MHLNIRKNSKKTLYWLVIAIEDRYSSDDVSTRTDENLTDRISKFPNVINHENTCSIGIFFRLIRLLRDIGLKL